MLARMESLQRMADDFKVHQRDVDGLKKATTSKTCSGAEASSCSSSNSDDNCSYLPRGRSRMRKHCSMHSPRARNSRLRSQGSGHSSRDRTLPPPPSSRLKGKAPMRSMSSADIMENPSMEVMDFRAPLTSPLTQTRTLREASW